MAFTNTSKQVTALIGKIDGRTLRAAIQTAAVSVIGHAMQHGHSPLANALIDRMAMSPMLRKLQKPLTGFLVKNGPFSYSEATGFVFSKDKKAEMIEAGYAWESFADEAKAWDDEAKAAPKDEALDLVKSVESLIAKANKKVFEGKCLDGELVNSLAAALGQYVGKKTVAKAAKAAKAAKVESEEAQEAREEAAFAAMVAQQTAWRAKEAAEA